MRDSDKKEAGAIRSSIFVAIIVVLTFGVIGCKQEDKEENGIAGIKLICADLCKSMPNAPFTEITVTHADEIAVFQESIREAIKIEGVLDYAIMYRMHVSYEDGTAKDYVLNVADEDEGNALLVDMEASSTGYSVQDEQTQKLRRIIYGDQGS